MNLGVLEVAQILPLGGMWAEIPYRMLDSLLSPTYCVHQFVGPSVHLNDLKAVGVVGVAIGVGGGIVGIVVMYHKYSKID